MYIYTMKNYESVGIIIIARDTNNFLLLHRVKTPVTWSTLSGKMEVGEDTLEAIKREIIEEIGIDPMMIDDIQEVGKANDTHHVMVGYVDREFDIPNLKMDENNEYGWFNETNLPSPIHPKWDDTFNIVRPLLNLRENFKRLFNQLIHE